MAINETLEREYIATLSIEGEDWGSWDKLDGGERLADSIAYLPGGEEPERHLGGPTHVGNVTLQRGYDLSRDHTKIRRLKGLVNSSAVAKKQPLDSNKAAFGDPETF